jgi:hypothetical protein
MAADAAPSSLRSIFEKFVTEAEVACAESRTRARYDIAEQLNQAVRRMRQSGSTDEVAATLIDVAGAFTGGLSLFRIDGENASAPGLEFALSAAPAFRAALESGDPVVAASTPGEMPAEIPEKLGHAAGDRVWIFPVQAGKRATAALYCWGDVAVPVVKLYTQVAGGAWLGLLPAETPAPAAAPELVSIAPAPQPPPPLPVEAPPVAAVPPVKRASSWDDLPSSEQQIHLRAQRFARVHASTMRLNQPTAVQAGRLHHNLYEMLREPIDEARGLYRTDFFDQCSSMVDYLHLELVHTLANDDAELLGSEYPGPLV